MSDESEGFVIEAYRIPTEVFNEEDFEHYINVVISTTQDEINEGETVLPKLTIITNEAKYIMRIPNNSEEIESFLDALKEQFPIIRAIVYVNEQWKISISSSEQYDMYMNNPLLVADNPLKDELVVLYAKGLGLEYWFHINFCRDDSGKVVWQEMGEVELTEESLVYDEIIIALRDMI